MDKFFTWAWKLFRDQRGAAGDDDSADDSSDKEDKEEDQDEGEGEEEEEDLDELFIDLDKKGEEEEEKDKEAKKKADEAKAKKSEEEVKKLRSEVGTFKEKEKEWKRREYQARKEKKEESLEADKDGKPLTDAQLTKLLEDASKEDDTQIQLNVLKYLARRISKGEVKEAVGAAEMSRKADSFTKVLEERFPSLADPTSDMRVDIDRTKEELGIVDHPYGDMFAVGFNLVKDMDALLESSYEAGKEDALKDTADVKRKKDIKEKALPSSRKPAYKKTHGLTASQLETAKQMELSEDQLPAYAKLVGKKPRTVSVEE